MKRRNGRGERVKREGGVKNRRERRGRGVKIGREGEEGIEDGERRGKEGVKKKERVRDWRMEDGRGKKGNAEIGMK